MLPYYTVHLYQVWPACGMSPTTDMGSLCVWRVVDQEGDKQHSSKQGQDQKAEQEIR